MYQLGHIKYRSPTAYGERSIPISRPPRSFGVDAKDVKPSKEHRAKLFKPVPRLSRCRHSRKANFEQLFQHFHASSNN
jgi:hypothetical protein